VCVIDWLWVGMAVLVVLVVVLVVVVLLSSQCRGAPPA
jgi:hypothetical protein